MERALVCSSFTEEGHTHLVPSEDAAREARTGGERKARSDDRVRAKDALARIRDVHGAAFALAEAGRLTEKLCHGTVHVGALGQTVAVTAMRGRDPIVLAQRRAESDGNRLLSEGRMDEAGDLGRAVVVGDPLLEGPDQAHASEQFDQVCRVGCPNRHRHLAFVSTARGRRGYQPTCRSGTRRYGALLAVVKAAEVSQ